MDKFVHTSSGTRISIRHPALKRDRVVVIAPGFFQSKETPTFRRIETDLLESFDVISMDFRGHGKSGGAYTFSARENEDLLAVARYAHSHYGRVGVLAFSYGGSVAIIAQAEDPVFDSLICVGAPMAPREIELRWWRRESWRLALRGMEPGAGVRPGNPFLRKKRAIEVVSWIAPTPILLIHGTKDPTVDVRHSRSLFEAAQDPKKLVIIEGGSHAQDLYRTHRDEFLGAVNGWFRATL